MSLSNDIISQFVKNTNDNAKTTKKETITYGTVVSKDIDGKATVILDGTLTDQNGNKAAVPVSTTVSVDEGDRVIIMIKNHSAVITGNLGNPATTSGYVNQETKKVSDVAATANNTANDASNKVTQLGQVVAYRTDVEELTAEIAKIKNLEADSLLTQIVKANEGDIKDLSSDHAEFKEATVEELTVVKENVETLRGDQAEFEELTTGNFEAVSATIGNLQSDHARFKETTTTDLTAKQAVIEKLVSDVANITNADMQYANIDFSNIGKAAIEAFFSKSGMIGDLVVGDGTITGKLVGVTITGDLIEGNTVKADKLVVKGSDGLYYKLNIEAGATTSTEVSEADLQNGLHGTAIIAKTITAEKISVSDLVAFGATIGGFTITDGSLYSGAKSTVNNTTQGIYLDSTGQMSIGDASYFIKYYKDSSGNYKLEISAVDNLVIGGRNILQNSTSFRVHSAASGINASITDEGYLKIIAESGNENWLSFGFGSNYSAVENELSEGDKFVISFTMRSEDAVIPPRIYIKQGMGYNQLQGNLSDEWSTVWYAGEWKDTNDIVPHLGFSNLVGTYEIKNCKIEKGNKPTDWSPAPEDMATAKQITNLETSVKQNADAIELRAKKTELTNAINDVKIGGRNLIPVKAFLEARNVTSTKEFELKNVWAATFITNENLVKLLEPATQYTISYELELTEKTTVPTVFDMMVGFLIYSNAHSTWISLATNMSDTAVIGTKQTVQKTFTTPTEWNDESFIGYSRSWTTNGVEPIGFDAFKVTNFKIEKGNKATDWTPAPEDMATEEDLESTRNLAESNAEEIAVTESLIRQLSDGISMLVTDGNGTSLMTQTENGWTFSTADIQSSVNKISNDLNSLTEDVGDVGNTVGVLQQAVDDLGIIAEYVKITTYEDEPCIELGEGDSEFKLRITNTRMMFTEGSTVLAYFNNQSLYAKKIVVEEELQQGGFVWKSRSNGNLGLVWKGGNS